jgi:hypothetical protein
VNDTMIQFSMSITLTKIAHDIKVENIDEAAGGGEGQEDFYEGS